MFTKFDSDDQYPLLARGGLRLTKKQSVKQAAFLLISYSLEKAIV
ncbi:hypothetical protein APA_4101 [Pseudanabaena sp. lw0831]|nr:hypothetical protein [Pseudanabaena sp. lw0831]GBO51997.1 hypothetical protein APA_4101 [Pseudanabaena sp. lw0831]